MYCKSGGLVKIFGDFLEFEADVFVRNGLVDVSMTVFADTNELSAIEIFDDQIKCRTRNFGLAADDKHTLRSRSNKRQDFIFSF